MTHTLTITLADAADLAWAQRTVTAAHKRHTPRYGGTSAITAHHPIDKESRDVSELEKLINQVKGQIAHMAVCGSHTVMLERTDALILIDAAENYDKALDKLVLANSYGADQWRRGNAGKDPQEFAEWRKEAMP